MAGAGQLNAFFAPVLPFPRSRDPATHTYSAGSKVVEAIDRTYFLKHDTISNFDQLMSYDGATGADLPVVDHVVTLAFEYFGDPRPPRLPQEPAVGVQSTAYPAGENCVFQVNG